MGAARGGQRGRFLPTGQACAGPGQAAFLPPLQGVCGPWAHGHRTGVCPVALRQWLADTSGRGWPFTHLDALKLDVKKNKVIL